MKSTVIQFPGGLSLRLILGIALIGAVVGSTLFTTPGASAHTLPPCMGWPAPAMAALGQPRDSGERVIVDMAIWQEGCGLVPRAGSGVSTSDAGAVIGLEFWICPIGATRLSLECGNQLPPFAATTEIPSDLDGSGFGQWEITFGDVRGSLTFSRVTVLCAGTPASPYGAAATVPFAETVQLSLPVSPEASCSVYLIP